MMSKLEGALCPICKMPTCSHRCDNCFEKFFYPQYFQNGNINETPRGTRYPCDEMGNKHTNCMRNGTYDGKFHNKDYRNQKNQEYLELRYEKQHDLHEYLRNKAVFHSDGYWYCYHDNIMMKREKATDAERTSWSP